MVVWRMDELVGYIQLPACTKRGNNVWSAGHQETSVRARERSRPLPIPSLILGRRLSQLLLMLLFRPGRTLPHQQLACRYVTGSMSSVRFLCRTLRRALTIAMHDPKNTLRRGLEWVPRRLIAPWVSSQPSLAPTTFSPAAYATTSGAVAFSVSRLAAPLLRIFSRARPSALDHRASQIDANAFDGPGAPLAALTVLGIPERRSMDYRLSPAQHQTVETHHPTARHKRNNRKSKRVGLFPFFLRN